MATLFVARDASGATRFVGDVPRGAACACFCPVCNSPLVAKQGDELEWHFAHEAGTERPECRAGAMNLLRRLAVQDLARRGLVVLPPYAVAHPLAGRSPVEWSAHPAGQLELLEVHGAQTPAARLPLREGGAADLYVCIDREAPPAARTPQDAILVLWCPYPADGQIRTEEQARAFVRSCSRLRWQSLPDFTGQLAAAQREAREFMERLQRERAQQAGARWAAYKRAREADARDRRGPAPTEAPDDRHMPAPRPQSAPAPEWAPGLMAGSSIHYRELDDGSQWVCFQHAPGQWRLCPVPHPHEGWDESFPPSIAVPEGNAWLRVADFGKLLMLFNRHATASEIDSDPGVIERRFRE
jgi:hypothetical protein